MDEIIFTTEREILYLGKSKCLRLCSSWRPQGGGTGGDPLLNNWSL